MRKIISNRLYQLLWLGNWLLAQEVPFEVRVLTANGIESWAIGSEENMERCITTLLDTPFAREGSLMDVFFKAAWCYHIGGEQDEA